MGGATSVHPSPRASYVLYMYVNRYVYVLVLDLLKSQFHQSTRVLHMGVRVCVLIYVYVRMHACVRALVDTLGTFPAYYLRARHRRMHGHNVWAQGCQCARKHA
jgi:hypothetical protein